MKRKGFRFSTGAGRQEERGSGLPTACEEGLRGPLNNRGQTQLRFAGILEIARRALFVQAERIPLLHWEVVHAALF